MESSKVDYITREAAIEAIKQTPSIYSDEIHAEDAIDELNTIPAADVRPVVRGHWTERLVEMDKYGIFRHRWHCSACGGWQTYGYTDFCPMCGAKMDEEA